MRKIAVINQKGGSGKTTTTVNLAAALAEQKRTVLVLDLDPQGSTSMWLGYSCQGKELFAVFTDTAVLSASILPTTINNVSLIPSSSWLMGLEKALAHEVGSETILRRKLQELGNAWDYVLIDCPPTLGILTVNALSAVDEVIVPVETRIMALSGLVQLLQTIDIVRDRLNNTLRISGIVPCRVDTRTKHSKEVVEELRTNFKELVYKTAIRENIRLSEAPSFTKPITLYDTDSTGAADYRLLAAEVIAQECRI